MHYYMRVGSRQSDILVWKTFHFDCSVAVISDSTFQVSKGMYSEIEMVFSIYSESGSVA